MRTRLAILGGSSPFTVALIDALAAAGTAPAPLAPMALALAGRNEAHLALVHAYAVARLGPLGWTCQASCDAGRMLDGAGIVLHQNRYGGLALRAAGEQLCHEHGVAADETLGPAALLAALLGRAELDHTIALLERHSPQAHVLNLTNPLSLVTARMAAALPRCVGLCELPLCTARAVAAVLGLTADPGSGDALALHWDYRGLNHRGFLVRLAQRNTDMLPRLIETLTANAASGAGPATIGGIGAGALSALGAVPLKYFGLFTQPGHGAPGRAAWLDRLRARIAQQLRQDGTRPPPAAGQRDQPWYPHAVVPLLAALDSPRSTVHVLNLPCRDGLVREMQVPVSRAGIGAPLPAALPGQPVARWLERFDTHERAAGRAVADPSRPRLLEALRADPSVPPDRARALLAALAPAVTRLERGDHVPT